MFGSILALAALSACGGSEPPADYPKPSAKAPEEPKPPPGALWREVVNATVDQGLGYFLQRVEVEPSFDSKGSFQGFRIMELRGDGFWDGVDLRKGDVVLRVNDKPIEREGQAYEVFQELKSVDELKVQYLRQGRRMSLSYRIIPRGTPEPASDSPAKPGPAPEPVKPEPAKPKSPPDKVTPASSHS